MSQIYNTLEPVFDAYADAIKQNKEDIAQVNGSLGDVRADLNNENAREKLNSGVMIYEGGDNIYDSSDPSMLLTGKFVNSNGEIIDHLEQNVIVVPVYDLTALYTLMTKNSAGVLWIYNTGNCGCFDINMNPLGLATTVTNGRHVSSPKTCFLGFSISNTSLTRQPMVVRNWDGKNKSAMIPYTPVAPLVDAGKIANLDNYSYRTTFTKTENLVNLIGYVSNKVLNNGNLIDNESYDVSGYIPVEGGANYIISYCQHFAWFDVNKIYITQTNNVFSWVAPANAAFARFDVNKSLHALTDVVLVKGTTLPTHFVSSLLPIYKMPASMIYGLSQWSGKTWAAYGDSITAISNGDGIITSGWAKYVNNENAFSDFYGRGIGSQKFAWGTNGGSVTFVTTETGKYHSRNNNYNKDNYTGEIPEGCVAIRGAFCSWDRITHMFPASIKNSIDMVFIMGGTNDSYDDTALAWIANDITDAEWAESYEYADYGGDYNITTLRGGIASTIMKMQAWMPNAIIVLGTPLNGQTNSSGSIMPSLVPDEYQKSNAIKDIAMIFGTPCIDVFGACGVNVLNSPTYITDGTHPYNTDGNKMVARAIIGGLKGILPNI